MGCATSKKQPAVYVPAAKNSEVDDRSTAEPNSVQSSPPKEHQTGDVQYREAWGPSLEPVLPAGQQGEASFQEMFADAQRAEEGKVMDAPARELAVFPGGEESSKQPLLQEKEADEAYGRFKEEMTPRGAQTAEVEEGEPGESPKQRNRRVSELLRQVSKESAEGGPILTKGFDRTVSKEGSKEGPASRATPAGSKEGPASKERPGSKLSKEAVQEPEPAKEEPPSYFRVYLKKWQGAGVAGPVVPPWTYSAMSFTGSFTGIGTLGLVQTYLFPALPAGPKALLIGSFGAMAVLVFGQPIAPPSQPWNCICGNTLGAVIGVMVNMLLTAIGLGDVLWLVGALAVSLAIVGQELTQSQHPPGGATALLFSLMPPLKALGPSYVLCPALLGAVIFVFLAAVINNASSRSYPSSIYPLPEPPEPKALMGELKKEIQNAFNVFDADGSGEIDSMELTLTMRALGLNPTPAEVREIMAEVDDDGSGTMEFEEFANLMQKMILAPSTHKDDILYSAGGEMNLNKLQLCAKAMRDPSLNPEEMESLEAQLQEEIVEAFNMFDEDGSGEIDEEEMENSMRALGLKPTDEEVKQIIAETDKTGSGTINLEEFGKLMRDLIVNPKTHKDDILNSSGSDEFDLKNLQRITTELRATLTEKELQEGKMEEDALSPMAEYLKKFKGKGAPPMPRPPIKQTLFSWLGSFSGIASLGLLQKYVLAPLPTGDVVLLVGSFGAMSVLLYSMPAAPFSQPKNALLGNTIGGAVGVAVVKAFELCHLGHMLWLMAALAVSLTIVAQERTTSVHPPGGATALIFVMKSCVAGLPPSHSFGVSDVWDWFIFCPGFLGTAILVFVALTINNISEKRNYPARWWS